MKSACPYCFTRLGQDEVVYRCTSGGCSPEPDLVASEMAGWEVPTTNMYRQVRTEQMDFLPTAIPCRACSAPCSQEVCPTCHRDLPARWRDNNVFTLAVLGGRGCGKSVYIAVAVETLTRYVQSRGWTISAETTGTHDVYSSRYYAPLFKENKAMDSTPNMETGGAYQRDPLIWSVGGGPVSNLHIIMRDVAGEDVEKRMAGTPKEFSFIDRADLVVFLFDPLMLESVRQVLSGVIPDVDPERMGARPGDVLPRVLDQTVSGSANLALVISKFDSLQQMPQSKSPLAAVFANPAAHFNQDVTMRRTQMSPEQAWSDFEADSEFLDAEVRALFDLIHEETVTLIADQAVQAGRVRQVRHFAVSAVGESPLHKDQLTERGISPFRVLDPILWGLAAKGIRL